jgi:PadR family transcriptional regulator PadR
MLDELTSAKMIVVEGTLYPLLTRLKNSGLLEYKWIESKSGPPRKYYKLTDKGIKFLEKLTQTWEELIHSTELITSRTTKTTVSATNDSSSL